MMIGLLTKSVILNLDHWGYAEVGIAVVLGLVAILVAILLWRHRNEKEE